MKRSWTTVYRELGELKKLKKKISKSLLGKKYLEMLDVCNAAKSEKGKFILLARSCDVACNFVIHKGWYRLFLWEMVDMAKCPWQWFAIATLAKKGSRLGNKAASAYLSEIKYSKSLWYWNRARFLLNKGSDCLAEVEQKLRELRRQKRKKRS